MTESEDRVQTEVATFRMPKTRLMQLKKEARKHHLNVNAMVNQIVESHLEFYSVCAGADMMPFSKRLLSAMMDRLDKEEISALSRVAAESDIPNLVYMKATRFTIDSVLDTLLAWIRHSGIQYRDTFEERRRTITLQHHMGKKWSQFMSEFLSIIFEKFGVNTSFEKLNHVLVIHIENGPK